MEKIKGTLMKSKTPTITGPNALLNEVVLTALFKLLDYDNLKSCRRVCSKWKSVSETMFRKQSKITTCNAKRSNRNGKADMEYLKVLFSPDVSAIRITSLRLGGTQKWVFTELEEFFRNEGSGIIDLKLENLKLVDEKLRPIMNVDVSTLITPNLRKFEIGGPDLGNKGCPIAPSPYILYLRAMMSLDQILLGCCTLVLSSMEEMVTNPCEIVLDGLNHYFVNGSHDEVRHVTRSVKFRPLKKVDKQRNFSLKFCCGTRPIQVTINPLPIDHDMDDDDDNENDNNELQI